MYDVILDGLRDGVRDGKKYFIIHLTTDKGVISDIWSDFLLLVARMREVYRKDKEIEYFAVETDEGNGVVHVVFKDIFLPRAFYAYNWSKIHHSYIVRFEEVDVKRLVNLAVYLSTQANIRNVWHTPFWSKYVKTVPVACGVDFGVDLLVCKNCKRYKSCLLVDKKQGFLF